MLIKKVNQTIERYGMLGDGKLLIGVSGEVDFVVLLDVLQRFVPPAQLVIGHIGHEKSGYDSLPHRW